MTTPVPYQLPIFNESGSMNPAWLSWFNSAAMGLSSTPGSESVDTAQVISILEETLPTGSLDFTVPPILTGFAVTSGFNTIFIEWNTPIGANYSYVEIYRSNSEIFSYAIPVGTALVNIFGDTPPNSSMAHTYYYWARIISKAGVPGPFNAVLGTPGTTANDPTYMIELLQNKLTTSELNISLSSRIDLVDTGPSALTTRMALAEGSLTTISSAIGELTTPDFTTANIYTVGLLVKYTGSIYKCILDISTTPSPLPTNSTYWELVGDYASLSDMVAANASGLSFLDTRIDTADENITAIASDVSALQTTISDPLTGLAKAVSNITQLNTVTSTSTSANALALYNISTKVTNPSTGLDSKASTTELNTANSDLNRSHASALFQTSTTLNGRTASVQSLATSVDGVAGSYTVKVDSNGYVAGYGLAVDTNTSTPLAEFAIVADKFSIAPVATNPDAADGSPFFHLTVPTWVNGVLLPAGTFMKTVFIGDATISNAKIVNIAADKMLAGTIKVAIEMTAATVTGGIIRSSVGAKTGTGGIVLEDQTLTVYDTNMVARVKLGLLP
jgi:hypothetical protein